MIAFVWSLGIEAYIGEREGERERKHNVEETLGFIRLHILLGIEGVEHSVLFGIYYKDISVLHSFLICNLLKEERSSVDLETKNKPKVWDILTSPFLTYSRVPVGSCLGWSLGWVRNCHSNTKPVAAQC